MSLHAADSAHPDPATLGRSLRLRAARPRRDRRPRPGRSPGRGADRLYGHFCGLLALCVLAPTAATAQLVSTNLPTQGAAARAEVTVTLTWSQPVAVAVRVRGQEVILRSDAALDHSGFATLGSRLRPWVSAVQLGYDSVVLLTLPGVSVVSHTGPTEVKLTLRKGDAPPPGRLFDPVAARQRLRFLKAALLWSTGDAWEAGELLRQMREADPDNQELLAADAVVQTRLGRWRRASADLDRARTLQGVSSRGTLPAKGSVEAPQATITLRSDSQSDGLRRLGARVGGHAFVGAGVRLLGDYAYAKVAENRAQRGTLGARHDFVSGSWLAAHGAISADETIAVGGAAALSIWDAWGQTRLDVAWNEPNWALPALINRQATRSAVGLRRGLRSLSGLGRPLSGDVSAEISAHLERWRGGAGTNEERVDDVYAAATLRYVSWRSRPRLWASYTIIALHVLNTEGDATTPSTNVLGPLLAQSHIHSVNAGARIQLWRWLEVTGHGGYGLRFGGADAAQFGAGLSWTPPSGLRASVNYDRGFQPTTYGISTAQLVAAVSAVF